jgi:hypothetical protein
MFTITRTGEEDVEIVVVFSELFEKSSDCLLYCGAISIMIIQEIEPTAENVNQIRSNLKIPTCRGRPQSISRLVEILSEYKIKMTKIILKEKLDDRTNVNNGLRRLIEKVTTGLYLCKVSENKYLPAGHCILVQPEENHRVYDLCPKYEVLAECNDIIFEVWKLTAK